MSGFNRVVHRPNKSLDRSPIWAKSPNEKGEWLPLSQHLSDAAHVAEWLWDHWLADSVKRMVASDFENETHARSALLFLAGTHDVGKASAVFVAMADDLFKCCKDDGLEGTIHRLGGRVDHHSRLGNWAVIEFMTQQHKIPYDVAAGWAIVIGAHHGDPPFESELGLLKKRRLRSPLSGSGWKQVREELISEHWRRSGLDRLTSLPALSQRSQVLLTGLVIMADWIASNEEFFGYSDLEQHDRVRTAMAALKLGRPWAPVLTESPVDLFEQRFGDGFVPHEAQRVAVDAASSMGQPGLLIIETPMGQGKTEAALVAAEVLAAKFGAGGVHIALPTQATTDGMFGRVLDWAASLPDAELELGSSLWLGHGKAFMNEAWGNIALSRDLDLDESDQGLSARLVSHDWMKGRKRAFLASICVSTIDHVLLGALRSNHVMLRHLGMAGKVLVLDEVHAYDAWMNGYLDRMLAWLGEYEVPVVLLSATLPPARRAALIEAYCGEDAEGIDGTRDAIGYPLITTAMRRAVSCQVVDSGVQDRSVLVEMIGDDDAALIDHVRDAVEVGGCVLVIRNTVTRAQRAGELLSQALGPELVRVNHSRFMTADRASRDSWLLNSFGKPERVGASRPEGFVVVSTQVVEQSLDVDFDLLITDIAPMDLLLQRVGRMHRHDRDRPAGLETPRLLITGAEIIGREPPRLDRGSTMVYDSAQLLASAAILSRSAELRLPSQIPDLVREAYDEEMVFESGWRDAVSRSRIKQAARLLKAQAGSSVGQLDPPRGNKPYYGWVGLGLTQLDDAKIAASVRDIEPSIEAHLVVRGADGLIRLPHWCDGLSSRGAVLQSDRPLPWRLRRDLEGCVVRLPAWISTEGMVMGLYEMTPPAWEEGKVGADRPFLILDENMSLEVVGKLLTYDVEKGLRVRNDVLDKS